MATFKYPISGTPHILHVSDDSESGRRTITRMALKNETAVPYLVQRYWQACRDRGDNPKPVWCLRADGTGAQPRGYPMGWSINKKQAERELSRIGEPCLLERIIPT